MGKDEEVYVKNDSGEGKRTNVDEVGLGNKKEILKVDVNAVEKVDEKDKKGKFGEINEDAMDLLKQDLQNKGYEFLDHTADVKFRAMGKSVEEAFIYSAKALFETIYGDLKVENVLEEEIKVSGNDVMSLLYNFLEEFLFLLDVKGLVFRGFSEMTIESNALSCVAVGDNAEKYEFTNDVKAMTYSDMKVEEKDGKWIIEGVFDV